MTDVQGKAEVDRAVKQLKDRLGDQEKSFAYLVSRWSGILRKCSDGYSGLYLDDYLRDLYTRRTIEEIRLITSDAGRAYIDQVIASIDQEFRELTAEARRHLGAEFWWYWRVPRNPAQEICRELLEYGYISDPPLPG